MHLEFGKNYDPTPRTPEAAENTQHWLQNRHVQKILKDDPRIAVILEKALQYAVMTAALEQAEEKDASALAADLADGLEQVYADLDEDCPSTIADLDARAQLDEAIHGTTGTARDYFTNRLMGVTNIADLTTTMTLPPALHESLRREADRLATLLVAMKRAEQSTDEALAA